MKIFFKQNFYYFLYLLTFLGMHLVLISSSTFFHFILEHKVAVIESWIYEHAWIHIILAKLLALFLVAKIILIYSNLRYPFKDFLLNNIAKVDAQSFVIIAMLFILIPCSVMPLSFQAQDIDMYKILISYIGLLLYYFLDLLFLDIVSANTFGKKSHQYFLEFSYSLQFILCSYIVFPQVRQNLLFFFFNFIICFLLKKILWSGALYLAVVAVPYTIILALDPLWKNMENFVTIKRTLDFRQLLILFIMVLLYLKFKSYRNFSHSQNVNGVR